MNATQLLEHFDRLAEAPNAVPRLRRFILDLAVRGKLVEQDAGDEPASMLLKQIEGEIARLVKIGEMRKPKALPPIEIGEEPFDAPTGWCWVRIRQVTSDRGQTTPVGDFTYIDVGSINKEAGVLGEHKILSASDAPSRARKVVGKGDVLYSCVRPTLLNIAVVEDEIKPVPIASTAFAVLNSFGLVVPRYLWIALRSPYLEGIVESGMRGQAYPAINDSEFAQLPLALPPLSEQHRIVAKVDELMALCDQLEAAQQERERRRDRLAAASLQRLNQPAADTIPEAQREHARFHLQHLPRLTTRPEHIKAMRQTVFNLAVRGKLVPQDTSDVSAQKCLLENDAARKIVASSDRRADIDTQQLLAHELCWDVPATWAWRGLADLALFIDYRGQTPNKVEAGVRLITAKNVKLGFINLHPEEFLTEPAYEVWMTRGFPRIGDVLFTTEAPMGNAAVVKLPERFALAQRVINFRLYGAVDPHFLVLQMISQPFQQILDKTATGLTAKGIKAAKLKRLPIAVPPLAEQHRIVAKVDELMALCDQLEAQLNTTQTDSRRLLEAVLEAALMPS